VETERAPITIRHPEGKPTPKQVYALAHELSARAGLEFPTPCLRVEGGWASALIQRLRDEKERGAEM
jgi:hypothetical protein